MIFAYLGSRLACPGHTYVNTHTHMQLHINKPVYIYYIQMIILHIPASCFSCVSFSCPGDKWIEELGAYRWSTTSVAINFIYPGAGVGESAARPWRWMTASGEQDMLSFFSKHDAP